MISDIPKLLEISIVIEGRICNLLERRVLDTKKRRELDIFSLLLASCSVKFHLSIETVRNCILYLLRLTFTLFVTFVKNKEFVDNCSLQAVDNIEFCPKELPLI
ncbi:hypothetical protein K0M31_018141 [Melipona bicolor]|uniref:Uncharacterized protein n=1 Tax=Melipona bicolor TaxID=60889 RepID=A0AA40FD33_9HYME|nr:hypothetical protein K0M31_018141 [Melipona bicolor]